MAYHAGMYHTSFEGRRRIEALNAEQLAQHQLAKLNALLDAILPHNRFYAEKLTGLKRPVESLDALAEIPYTFKDELLGRRSTDQFASNLTFPPEDYVRFHLTSGTRGRPMVVLDTADDWRWLVDAWQYVLDVAEIGPQDRVMMAFSFGPFIGFWGACDAVIERGAMVVPGGGMSTWARLELLRTSRATALFCTPSYALYMAEKGREVQIDVAKCGIRHLVVSGEPGGSIPSIRKRLEETYDAKVIDHAGATEVGPWGYSDVEGRGLYVNEDAMLAEFLSVETGTAAGDGELAELVLTSLGRVGSPVIRYRTGDLVRPTWDSEGRNRFVLLEGGVLGRGDDMMVIRGVNLFPSSIEQIIRSFPEVIEFRTTAYKKGEMDDVTVEVEDRLDATERIARELQLRLGLRIQVQNVPIGSLPRCDTNANRFVDKRESPNQE